jgi:hypothetical protein
MFEPDSAKIIVPRSEPVELDVGLAILKVQERNRRLAVDLVVKSLLGSKKTMKRLSTVSKMDAVIESCKPFIESWNKWRRFYLNRTIPWEPKTQGQCTIMQRWMVFCEENDLSLDTLIGCTFRASRRRRSQPTLQLFSAFCIDNYEEQLEELTADVVEFEYDHDRSI